MTQAEEDEGVRRRGEKRGAGKTARRNKHSELMGGAASDGSLFLCVCVWARALPELSNFYPITRRSIIIDV